MTHKNVGLIKIPFLAKDGQIIVVKGNANLQSINNEPAVVHGVFRSNSECETAEAKVVALKENLEHAMTKRIAELQASERHFQNLVASIPGAVYEFCVDAAGHRSLPFVSEGIVDLFGCSAAECMADVEILFQLIPDHALPGMEASIRDSMEELTPWFHEFPVHAFMSEKWIRGHAIPQREADGSTWWYGVFVDVTRKKQMEIALRNNEQLFRSLTEAAPVGIFRTDPVGSCLYVNDRWCGITGMDAAAAAGDGWIGAIHPDDRENVIDAWNAAVKHQQPFRCEYRFQTEKRIITWILGLAQAERNQNGDVLGYVGTITNITDQKIKEAELAESRNLLKTIVDTVPAGIFWKDKESRYLGCNPIFAKNAGVESPQEIIGKIDYDLSWTKDQADHYRNDDRQVIDSGNPKLYYEEPLNNPAGETIWIATSRNQNGDVLGYVGTITNITDQKIKEAELAESRNLLKTIVDTVPAGIFWKDKESRYLGCNPIFAKNAGVESPQEIIGKIDYDLSWTKDQADHYRNDDRQVIDSGNPKLYYEEPLNNPAGETIWIATSKVPLLSTNHEIIGVLGIYQDITEQKQMLDSMSLAAAIYQSSSEAIMVTDENNRIIQINPAFTRMTGYEMADVIGKDSEMLRSGLHDEAFYQNMGGRLLNEGYWQGEIWDLRKDGIVHVKWLSINVIRHPDGRVHCHVAQFSDITEKNKKDEIILSQANYDQLTGLPNRNLFKNRLELEIKKSYCNESTLTLLLLDLDHFKDINDTLGHDKGDDLLREVALRLRFCIDQADTVARLGGDEFAVIITNSAANHLHVETLSRQIIQEMNKPFKFRHGQINHYISTSIGIASYPQDGIDMKGLMKHADQAMYAAKLQGRNRFCYFTASMQQEAHEKMLLTHDLRQAIEKNELHIYFQPILELSSGCIVKVEALLRWKHPLRGMISPATFIPLAEESGLIVEIGEMVFKRSIALIDQWRRAYGYMIQISVNVSPVQFKFMNNFHWLDHLSQLGLPGNCINMEITEGLLLKDSSVVQDYLLGFRNNGIEVSIDDFGTGFSSLSYLKKFDIDYLKIDRSFINQLIDNATDRVLVEAIIVMAHKLDIKTIAEGVETKEQEDLLVHFGCDYVQGFLYSIPIAQRAFEQLLVEQKNRIKA